jgi:hypothetical protein
MKPFLRRRSIRIVAGLAIASGTVGVASLTAVTTQAQADPSSQTAFVGVGADVTEDVGDALSGVAPNPSSGASNITYYSPLHATAADGGQSIESFDASPEPGTTTSPGCITTKVGGPSFDRPNSTTAGIAALLAAINGTGWENSSDSCTNAEVNVTGQIDFARAARGPKTAGTELTFVPYARDALGILYYSGGTTTLADITTADLTTLYSSGTGTATFDGVTVYACLPISSSSPVTNLESALGLTSTQIEAAATAAGCNGVQQNSGNSFLTAAEALPGGTAANAVIPISSGSWIGQANGVGYDRSNLGRAAGVNLANLTGIGEPYTGTAPSEVPNTTYYSNSSWGYNIFDVLPTSKLSGFTQSVPLEDIFVGTGSAICSATNQATIHTFGFDSLTAAEGTCGSTTTTGDS